MSGKAVLSLPGSSLPRRFLSELKLSKTAKLRRLGENQGKQIWEFLSENNPSSQEILPISFYTITDNSALTA